MVLESVMICVDNSDYMRNGDFVPNRMVAQHDAINYLCMTRTASNRENNLGLITLANVQVLATLTADVPNIMSKLYQLKPNGVINFPTAVRIAHLALKHRQGRNHKMRIVAFIGSPIKNLDGKDLEKLAKKLKKEKVNVDVVHFGEEATNSEVLHSFISTLNGADGTGSHLLTVTSGPNIVDALMTSVIVRGEDGALPAGVGGAGYEFGVDPNEDPELALALRVSMEEQRQRVETNSDQQMGSSEPTVSAEVTAAPPSDDAILEQVLAMSIEQEMQSGSQSATRVLSDVDFANMSEQEQLEYALRMSLEQCEEQRAEEKMDMDESDDGKSN